MCVDGAADDDCAPEAADAQPPPAPSQPARYVRSQRRRRAEARAFVCDSGGDDADDAGRAPTYQRCVTPASLARGLRDRFDLELSRDDARALVDAAPSRARDAQKGNSQDNPDIGGSRAKGTSTSG